MSLRPLIAVAALSMLATACGGRQSNDALATREWTSVFELVPADATYAYIYDPNEADANRLFEQLSAQQSASAMAPYAGMITSLQNDLGIDLTSEAAVRAAGIDPAGELAVFSTAIAPVFALRLSDEEAWASTLAHVIELNPDADVSTLSLAGLELTQLRSPNDESSVQFGVMNGYLVGRLFADEGIFELSDQDFIRILSASGVDIRTSDIAESVGPLVGIGHEMSALYFMRTEVINVLTNMVLSGDMAASSDALNAMGMGDTIATGGYESASQRAACTNAVERALITWPYTAGVSSREPGEISTRGSVVLQFSEAGAERIEAVFPGAVEGIAPLVSEAALFVAGRADVGALLDLFPADPALASCPDMARGLSMVGQLVESNRRMINQNLRLFNGGGAIAIFNLAPAGLSVDADIAVMVTSDSPSSYADRIQRLLESNGFSGRVAPEAAITTINFDSFLAEVTMLIPSDRVVLYTGNVATNVINGLALNAEASVGAPFLISSVNARTMETIYNGIVDFMAATNALDEQMRTILDAAFSPFLDLDFMTVEGTFVNNAMVITSTLTPRD
jgi:hypothetical protein